MSANTSAVKHYGNEWARANHHEMMARRYHIVSSYTGNVLASSHSLEEANDIRDEHYKHMLVKDTRL